MAKHLKHLTENKWVKRNKDGIQNISYELNWDILDDLEKARNDTELQLLHLEDKKIFSAKPFDEQIKYLQVVFLLKAMHRLRFLAKAIIEPDRALDYNLQYRMYDRYLQPIEGWFAEKLQESKKEMQTKTLQQIETSIEEFKKALFDPRPQSKQ